MLCFNYTVRFLGSVPVLSRLFNAGRSGLSVTDKHTQLKSSACRLRYRLRLQKDRAPAKRIRIADAQRDRAAQAIDGSPTPGERTAPPTGSQRPHQTRIEASARPVQPLEPILVPKPREPRDERRSTAAVAAEATITAAAGVHLRVSVPEFQPDSLSNAGALRVRQPDRPLAGPVRSRIPTATNLAAPLCAHNGGGGHWRPYRLAGSASRRVRWVTGADATEFSSADWSQASAGAATQLDHASHLIRKRGVNRSLRATGQKWPNARSGRRAPRSAVLIGRPRKRSAQLARQPAQMSCAFRGATGGKRQGEATTMIAGYDKA
uniref:Uncharacterized protein n=1 Tax=Trichuris muris TaxID=70415 RepID=A0A5S6Q135_TRIMR